MLDPQPAPLLDPPPPPRSTVSLAFSLTFPALLNFFWPVFVTGILLTGIGIWLAWMHSPGLLLAALVAVAGAALTITFGLVIAYLLYRRLASLEATDEPDDSLPDPARLEEIARDENRAAQNHMTGVSIMKPASAQAFDAEIRPVGNRQNRGASVSARIPEDDRYNSLRPLGAFARDGPAPVLLELWRKLGKLPRGFHHQGPRRPHRGVEQH